MTSTNNSSAKIRKIQANAMFSGKVKYLDTIMEKLLNDLNGYKFKNCLLSLFFLNNEKALKQGLKYAARERVQCGPRTSEKMKILKEILGNVAESFSFIFQKVFLEFKLHLRANLGIF